MKQKRILFIGNSFTQRNDLPGLIGQFAASADPAWAVSSRRVIANGQSLKAHWDKGTALAEIRRSEWDQVVLQEQSTLPLKNRERMHEYVRRFDAEIKARGARTVLYLTWARQTALGRQEELSDAYISIGRELGAIVVPVGIAWQRCSTAEIAARLYDRDQSHPSAAGSYLAACVFFAVLFGQSPVGLPVMPPPVRKLGVDVATHLQQTAWEASREFLSDPS